MIVLDSSFLIAQHNARDSHHTEAVELLLRIVAGEFGVALLPEYIFLEVTTVIAARRDLATAISVGRLLLDAKEVEFVPCSEHFRETFEIFSAQDRAALSFADAAIIAIARGRQAAHVATFDRHFNAVAGITVVP